MRTMENQYSDIHILRLQASNGKTLSNFRSIREVNWTRTHNQLAHKRTLNRLAKLAKYVLASILFVFPRLKQWTRETYVS